MVLGFKFVGVCVCFLFLQSCAGGHSAQSSQVKKSSFLNWGEIEGAIEAQRRSGYPNYNPEWLYVVDPRKQRMYVISLKTRKVHQTLRCGTGKKGLGTAHAQTPPGFWVMGGVRLAKNGDASIQTGDTKKGVSGIYAEIVYPPSHSVVNLRGRVPNGVVIHSYNPVASEMLRRRRAERMIGRVPCTTGCPVPDVDEAHKLLPYLRRSAGKFDPTSKPNGNLRALIRQGKVKIYEGKGLGDPIYILNRQ